MIDLLVVTGYVPIPGHPRSAREYGELGEKLRDGISAPIKAFYTQPDACWLSRYVHSRAYKVTPQQADNPDKNSLLYHIVNHQKSYWLHLAAADLPSIKTFVWVDYGIFHQPGITARAINNFLEKIKERDFAIPGCWDDARIAINDEWPCWRFCGSLMVVPRPYVLPLTAAMAKTVSSTIKQSHKLTWEVNTLARVEQNYPKLPIRWYSADHNVTQFDNYEAPDAQIHTD